VQGLLQFPPFPQFPQTVFGAQSLAAAACTLLPSSRQSE
jgi:hypothetical protein